MNATPTRSIPCRRALARGSRPGHVPATLLALGLLAALATPLRAHEGPPFPVLVDEVDGPWSISVWADPDVGVGTFWIMLDPAAHQRLPDDTRVDVHVAPADGREPETSWTAEASKRDDGQQHVAKVDFPTREFWLVRLVVASDSAGASAERIVRVEVTPPGYGPIDLLLYLWPFLALAVLWLKALSRHRAAARATAQAIATDIHAPEPAVNRHA